MHAIQTVVTSSYYGIESPLLYTHNFFFLTRPFFFFRASMLEVKPTINNGVALSSLAVAQTSLVILIHIVILDSRLWYVQGPDI